MTARQDRQARQARGRCDRCGTSRYLKYLHQREGVCVCRVEAECDDLARRAIRRTTRETPR